MSRQQRLTEAPVVGATVKEACLRRSCDRCMIPHPHATGADCGLFMLPARAGTWQWEIAPLPTADGVYYRVAAFHEMASLSYPTAVHRIPRVREPEGWETSDGLPAMPQ